MPEPRNLTIRQIALEIFGGCNYKCAMCPQESGREKEFLRKIPYDVFTKVVDDGMQYGLEVVSLQGSGEPTVHPEMPKFVQYVKSKGLQCISLTNGNLLTPDLSRALIEAGIDCLRVSAIGYDRETYKKWMSKDAFDKVRDQVREFIKIRSQLGKKSEITLYHMITDITKVEYEIEQYRKNWVDYCECPSEIWMMHNWSGLYDDIPYNRPKTEKRSCGRPSSPYLTVRAGGLNGKFGAVVPCCFVLGQDSKAVLGNLQDQTIAEVVGGPAYEELRQKHADKDFESIDYCKNCDQLYDAPESLVWTNIPGKKYGQSKYLKDLDYRKWSG